MQYFLFFPDKLIISWILITVSTFYVKRTSVSLNRCSSDKGNLFDYVYGKLWKYWNVNNEAKHLENCWRIKDELISDILLLTPTNRLTSVSWPTKVYIHLLCMEVRYCLEDLPRAMANRDGWQERVKVILAISMLDDLSRSNFYYIYSEKKYYSLYFLSYIFLSILTCVIFFCLQYP